MAAAIVRIIAVWPAQIAHSGRAWRRDLVQHSVDHDLLALAPSKLHCLKFGQGGLLPLSGGLIGLGL
ncbi:MAG: hypothetical protein ACJ72M_18065 [Propionibacteriaceae bacterium]